VSARNEDLAVEQAAGVVCWRRAEDRLEVLLVHRPRYDDWSWPKGKVKDRESLPAAAVREAAEETGLEVVLGRPLGRIRYGLPDGRNKEVTYWAARPVGALQRDGDQERADTPPEVDALAWLAAPEARALLTRTSDGEPLHLLEEYADAGVLDTAPVLVVRHGTARPRDSWAGAEADRPLVSAGRRQSRALVPLVTCWRPARLVSSPWRRCLDTLAPFAAVAGLTLRTKGSLSEDGARRSPARAREQMQRLLDRARPVLLCTHRPVLAALLDVVRSSCPLDVAAAVPGENPYLAPGEVLVAHVAVAVAPARVVAVERHRPRP
jgi:8-oxo-(d)GTP phosphatase